MSTSKAIVEDGRIGVRLKISFLWISVLFLYAYGDIFGFFVPGRIEEVTGGKVSGITISDGFLLAVSVYIAIASAMIFLTLVLRANVSRWANLVLAVLYIASVAASAIGEDAPYYLFLSAAEVLLLLAIVRYAWTWPTRTADEGAE